MAQPPVLIPQDTDHAVRARIAEWWNAHRNRNGIEDYNDPSFTPWFNGVIAGTGFNLTAHVDYVRRIMTAILERDVPVEGAEALQYNSDRKPLYA